MKKIMKKALSLVLVMAMMLVPMTTAWAAENTSPMTAEAVENYGEVTVGAGEKLYFSATAESWNDQEVCVYDTEYEDGFNLYSVYNARPILEAKVASEWGSASIKLPQVQMRTIIFAIENTTSVEKTYGVMFWDAEGATADTAIYLQQGETTFSAYGSPSMTAYGFSVQKAGKVEVAMSESNEYGWKYSLEVINADGETTYTGEQHWSNDSTVVASEEVSVLEGDRVIVWINSLDEATNMSVAGDVTFTLTYNATDKDPYVYVWSDLIAGENTVALDGIAEVSVFPFNGGSVDNPYSSTVGKYKITVPSGCTLSIWEAGENWGEYALKTTVTGNTYEFDFAEEYATVYFGFAGVGGTVTIEKIGDIETEDDDDDIINEYTNYVNTVSPVPYEFTGKEENLFYVWVEGDKAPTAVLGADGYYHLGSATGPVLYVDLNMELHPFETYVVAGLQAIAGEGRLYNYSTKVDYSNALLTYAAFKDASTGLYPVTEDIKTILVEYGKGQGWYTVNGPAYMFDVEVAEESAWLFMCCYEGVIDTTVTDTTWVTDSEEGFVFKVNAEISDFKELKINGTVVDEEYYTLEEGSTIITISAEYLSTLEAGDYTVAAVFYNAEGAEVSFTTALTVTAPISDLTPVVPDTGDHSNIALWVAVLALGVVAIAGSVVMKKREF